MSQKRLNIITLEVRDKENKVIQSAGIVMRVTKRMADYWVANQTARYTSKSKMKSFSSLDTKINAHIKFLDDKGFMIEGEYVYTYKLKEQDIEESEKSSQPIKIKGKKVGHIAYAPNSGKVYVLLDVEMPIPIKYLNDKGKLKLPRIMIVGKQERS